MRPDVSFPSSNGSRIPLQTKLLSVKAVFMKSPNAFFDQVEQCQIEIDDHQCYLPLFYTGGTATFGFFPASMKRLKKKVPDSRLRPASIVPGVGVVAVIAFEFQTSIGPVNELCIAVPLSDSIIPLGLDLIRAIAAGNMNSWIWHLPVSTEIANVYGKAMWGFPKIHAEIPITKNQVGQNVCTLVDEDKKVLTLQGSVDAGHLSYDFTIKNHIWQNGRIQTADHKFQLRDLAVSMLPGSTKIKLEKGHFIADDLSDVLLSYKSLLSGRANDLRAILHEPDRPSLVGMKKLGLVSAANASGIASD